VGGDQADRMMGVEGAMTNAANHGVAPGRWCVVGGGVARPDADRHTMAPGPGQSLCALPVPSAAFVRGYKPARGLGVMIEPNAPPSYRSSPPIGHR